LRSLSLQTEHITQDGKTPRGFGKLLIDYFSYRADILNKFVAPRFQDAAAAKLLFEKLQKRHKPPPGIIPMNKQKGEKKATAYLTAIINTLINAHSAGMDCDFDPRSLTTVTAHGKLLRTLARRVDGAFPSVVNPIAVWEIKEYYYTTTFGSRVADGEPTG